MEPLLKVENLKTYFVVRRGIVKAVDGASFSLNHGESVGIVGESGCGKSMTALSILRLVPQPAGKIVGGRIMFEGEDLLTRSDREMRKIRGAKIAMVLQDPMTSLNPVYTIGMQIFEPIRLHQKLRGKGMVQKAIEALSLLRIPSAESRLADFPHQMSGGMRQRVSGAIALSCTPSLLIADEPTTSLDVTIQAQYLKVLRQVQEEASIGLIFITHDFGIVAKMCDYVVVMYAGRIVEKASAVDLFNQPKHPYTQGLLNCLASAKVRWEKLPSIDGQPPDLSNLPGGCYFAARCSQAMKICREQYPSDTMVGDNHFCSCWLVAK